jgi:hypothetical protein
MTAPVTITVSEDLNARLRDPSRFCATVDGDTDPERAGFGQTEAAALAYLAKQYRTTYDALVDGATIERIGVR